MKYQYMYIRLVVNRHRHLPGFAKWPTFAQTHVVTSPIFGAVDVGDNEACHLCGAVGGLPAVMVHGRISQDTDRGTAPWWPVRVIVWLLWVRVGDCQPVLEPDDYPITEWQQGGRGEFLPVPPRVNDYSDYALHLGDDYFFFRRGKSGSC